MLRSFREGVKGTTGKVLLAIIIVPFVGFGAFDLVTNRGGGQAVLEVNGEEIDEAYFLQEMNMVRNELASQMGENVDYSQLTEEKLTPIVRQRFVQAKLIEQFADKLEMRIPDRALEQRIVAMEDFQEEGKFSNERMQMLLATSGITLTGLKSRLANDLRLAQFSSGVSGSGFVNSKSLELMLKISEEERNIDSVRVSFAEQLKAVEVDDQAALKSYFDEQREQFKTELSIDVNYILLTVDNFRDSVSEEQIAEEYALRERQFESSESRSVSHILLEVNADQSEAQAKEQLTLIRERLAAGEDFATLAKEFSQDIGSAAFGGELGSAKRDGTFPEAFEQALFELELNAVSEPVVTDAGVHLLKVTDIETNALPSLEELREEIIDHIQVVSASKRYVLAKEELADLAFNADGLDEPASALELELLSFEKLSRSGANADSGEPAPSHLLGSEVLTALFSDELMNEGVNSELIELDPRRSIVVSVEQVREPRDRSYDEVEEQVLAMYRQDLLRERLQSIRDKAVSAFEQGQSLEEFATENDFDIVKNQTVSRRSTGDLEPDVLRPLFAAKRSTIGKVVHSVDLPNGDLMLYVLNSVNAASEAPPQEFASAVAQQANMLVSRQELMAVVSQLQQQAEIIDR